jgi:hypothetical protein
MASSFTNRNTTNLINAATKSSTNESKTTANRCNATFNGNNTLINSTR